MEKTEKTFLSIDAIKTKATHIAGQYRSKNIQLVIGLATGGVIPGYLVSQELGCAYVTIRPNLAIPEEVLAQRPLLIVDDILDSGKTKIEVLKNFADQTGVYFETLYTANPETWLVFPWESNQDKINARQTMYV